MLSTVVVAQSIHSLDSSGYDRERLLSVNAAEAGHEPVVRVPPDHTRAEPWPPTPGATRRTGKLTIADDRAVGAVGGGVRTPSAPSTRPTARR